MPLQQNCRNCGAPVELGRLDCAHCGTAFEKVSSTPEPGAKPKSAPAEDKKGEVQREERTQDEQPKKPEKESASSRAAAFAPFIACMPFVVVIVIVLAIFGFYALLVCAGVVGVAIDRTDQQPAIEGPLEPMEEPNEVERR